MSPKELLYIEDALGHETYFAAKCQEVINGLQDPGLKSCVEEMASRHKAIFQNFYGLL